MDLWAVIVVATALAMDAFSVCISAGMIIKRPGPRHYFRLAFHFGLFQFMMPIIGYYAGYYLEKWIKQYDHWVALALLGFIGTKMIYESLTDHHDREDRDPSRGWRLVVLAVATSIDALAVGFSIGVLNGPILVPSIIIGLVCILFSAAGIALGNRVGPFFGKRAEALGGVLLVAIGIKIIVEHLIVN